MNIRKNIDYSQMYVAIDEVMVQDLPKMELYCTIGKIVCTRSEKGAAVMASEYKIANYPDAKGFSPRSLRRMRDFYRTYENHPNLLSRAMQLGWIHNVVIMEANLTMELREWYLKAVRQFEWSKSELVESIATNIHEVIVLSCDENSQNVEAEHKIAQSFIDEIIERSKQILRINILNTYRWLLIKDGRRRWHIIKLISDVAFFCASKEEFVTLGEHMMQKRNQSAGLLYEKVIAFVNKHIILIDRLPQTDFLCVNI